MASTSSAAGAAAAACMQSTGSSREPGFSNWCG
jgi:hypothetical protein